MGTIVEMGLGVGVPLQNCLSPELVLLLLLSFLSTHDLIGFAVSLVTSEEHLTVAGE